MDIVVPGFNYTALSTLRCLRALQRQGARLWSVGPTSAPRPAYFSRLPNRILTHPPGGLTDQLAALGERFSAKALLLPTADDQVLDISLRRDRLAARYDFLFPEHGVLETLIKKTRFYDHAHRQAWPVAPTHVVRGEHELLRLPEQVRFPLVVKPYLKHAQRVDNPEELRAYASDLAPMHYQALVVQEWIPGGDDQLYFCFLLFDGEGRNTSAFTGRKLRQQPPHSGSTSLAVSVRREDLVQRSLALLAPLPMRGYVSLEYKHDTLRDRFVVMEPTAARFNLQIALPAAAGINFPENLCRLLQGGPVAPRDYQEGVYWIFESDDLKSHLTRRDGYGFMRYFFRRHVRVLFAWSDPLPFLAEAWYRLLNLLGKSRRARPAAKGPASRHS